MSITIAVFAQGEMGAGVGRRLVERGARVITCLEGRSAASRRRAQSAGMEDASFEALAEAEVFLSIVPPGQALGLGARVAALPRRAATLFVDCNAVSPQTALRIEAEFAGRPAAFVDAGIIGGPPKPDEPGPRIYACGPAAERFAGLRAHGLDIEILEGPIGAASALKMAYGGVTKGMTAIGAVMSLAALRSGAAEALQRELHASQPQIAAWLRKQGLGMIPKAYRWVDEMREIAAFQEGDPAAARIYEAIADVYARLARDENERKDETDALRSFFR